MHKVLWPILQLYCSDCHPNVSNDAPAACKKKTAIKRVKVVALLKHKTTTNFLVEHLILLKWSKLIFFFFGDFTCETFFSKRIRKLRLSIKKLSEIISISLSAKWRTAGQLSLKKIMQTIALFWTSLDNKFFKPLKIIFFLTSMFRAMVFWWVKCIMNYKVACLIYDSCLRFLSFYFGFLYNVKINTDTLEYRSLIFFYECSETCSFGKLNVWCWLFLLNFFFVGCFCDNFST